MDETMTTAVEIIETQELIKNGTLTAPDEFIDTPISVLLEVCNGCGAAGAKFDFIPDTLWGLCICAVCHIHDFEYHHGTTEEDRDRADDRFLMNGINLIETKSGNWFSRIARNYRMTSYYTAVAEAGAKAFWVGK